MVGTSCNLGVRLPDGRIEGTYVHYDGYPDHMVAQVCWFLQEQTTSCLLLEIRRAQAVGGFLCWHPFSTDPRDADVCRLDFDFRQDEEERYGLRFCEDVPSALRVADFVSVHTPLTPETRHLIGREELGVMKPTPILVNTARGAIVDNHALYEALRDGVIAGAGLDVTDPEPIPMDHPLLTLPNVVLTPHIGSATLASRTAMAVLAARNILACLRGEEMPTCLNPEVLRKD